MTMGAHGYKYCYEPPAALDVSADLGAKGARGYFYFIVNTALSCRGQMRVHIFLIECAYTYQNI